MLIFPDEFRFSTVLSVWKQDCLHVLSTQSTCLCALSNGGLDPWSAGGVTQNLTQSVVSIVIPEGAHHLDLRYSNNLDPPSVRAARTLELKYFQKWIKQYQKAAGRATASKKQQKVSLTRMFMSEI